MQRPAIIPRIALTIVLASACAAHAQYQSSSGSYFSSAGAAYMNTLSWSHMSESPELRKAEAEAAERARSSSGVQRSRADSATAHAAPSGSLTSSFRPVVAERAAALDGLMAHVPPGAVHDAFRARLELLATTVERGMSMPNNLAQATYLLIGISLQTARGQPLETARAGQLTRAIDDAYAKEAGFARLDDRQRSRIYYTYLGTTGLTAELGMSKDPREVAAGRELARNTLKSFGITP